MCIYLTVDEFEVLKNLDHPILSHLHPEHETNIVYLRNVVLTATQIRDFLEDLFSMLGQSCTLNDQERFLLSNLGWRIVHSKI